jgi:hypothetical protein
MKYSVLLFIFCFATLFVDGQEIKGIVKTTDGKPLEQVLIRPGFVETDKEGKFVLKGNEHKFLIITKDGFQPLLKKINDNSEIEISLETEDKTDSLVIHVCSGKEIGERVGININLFVPKGLKSKRVRDVDYVNFYIFAKADQKNFIEGCWGPNATRGYPDADWINSTDKINIRAVTDKKREIGFVYFGQTKEGKSWRYIRVFDESVFYIVDSMEKKNAFDKIIESSCSTVERYFKE